MWWGEAVCRGEEGLSALPDLASSLHVLCPEYLALDAQCPWLLLCLESTLLCPSPVLAGVMGKPGHLSHCGWRGAARHGGSPAPERK